MWTSEIIHENNQVSRIIFDFGQGITIIADCKENTLIRYHGQIAVEEYHDSFKIDELNKLLENVSEEITL
jgi:hypothetical protein